MKLKPPVYEVTTLADFQPYYWDVKELHSLCKRFGLTRKGIKDDLIQRIAAFLETGQKDTKQPSRRAVAYKPRDSEGGITTHTPVVNYNNDALTRAFFVQEVGPHFRFNAYLRQFSKTPQPHLTYGDLVTGYRAAELEKRRGPKQAIDKQFAYNQFQRDYFLHEQQPTRQQCTEAWKWIRSIGTPTTYAAWKQVSDTTSSQEASKPKA